MVKALAATLRVARHSQAARVVFSPNERALRARRMKTAWVTSSAKWRSRTRRSATENTRLIWRDTNSENAFSELETANSRSNVMSSLIIQPIHLHRRPKVTVFRRSFPRGLVWRRSEGGNGRGRKRLDVGVPEC